MRWMCLVGSVVSLMVAMPAAAQTVEEPSERARSLATEYVEQLDIEQLVADLYQGIVEAGPEWQRLQQEVLGREKGASGMAPMPTFTPELDMEALRPYLDIVENLLVETYARTYSESQLREMIRFDSSRAGQGIRQQRDDFVINLVTVMIEQMPQIREQLGFTEDAATIEVPDTDLPPTRGMQPTTPLPPGTPPGVPQDTLIVDDTIYVVPQPPIAWPGAD